GNYYLFFYVCVKRCIHPGNYTCHCSNIYGTANWTISVEVVAMDAVQQRRMAQSSWSSELEEDEHENLENEDEFSSS
ncbi:Uncharacterized protein APZ42_001320, partial [Daphnia magna]